MAEVSSYSARVSFTWQNLQVFQMRGRARITGGNLLADGPFVLWGSKPDSLLRCDFYGPDGKPVVSIRIDSSGALVYFPGEESAIFSPEGLQVGDGSLPVSDFLHLIRTGFPLEMEQWQMCEGALTVHGTTLWSFCTPGSDSLLLHYDSSNLFPDRIVWNDGAASITGSTYHDEYSAWPESWLLEMDGNEIEVTITRLQSPAEPWDGLWELNVPVEIDTLAIQPPWRPSWVLPIR